MVRVVGCRGKVGGGGGRIGRWEGGGDVNSIGL